MKSNLQKVIISVLLVICIILIIILTVLNYKNYSNAKNSDKLQNKILSEIDFISTSAIDALNKLNNLSVVRYKIYTETLNTNNNNSSNGAKQQTLEKNEIKSSDSSKENTNSTAQDESSQSGGSNEQGKSGQSNNQKSQSKSDNQSGEMLTNNDNINPNQMLTNNSLFEVSGGDIDWDNIEYIYENIFTLFTTVTIDLDEKNVDTTIISNYNISLNGIAQSIIEKDKTSCMINFFNLYKCVNETIKSIVNDQYTLCYYETVTNILNAYILANQENKFKEMEDSINKSINSFSVLLNDDSIEYNKKQNIKRINYKLKNTKESIKLYNKNIFYLQYKTVMQDLITL